MKSSILDDLISRYNSLSSVKNEIFKAFEITKDSFKNGGTLFLCGNGGSAADAEHMAGELLKEFKIKRGLDKDFTEKLSAKFGNEGLEIGNKLQKGLPTISLTSHLAFSTAFLNDVDPSLVFAQQLYVLGKKDDVLIAFSTSGNSKNVVKSIQIAAAKGIKSIVLTGIGGGKCAEIADCTIKVPEKETYKIQELHLPIYHALCLMLEEEFYGSN